MHGALVTALPDADAVEGGEEFVAGHGWVLCAGLVWRWWVLVEAVLVRVFGHCGFVRLPPPWPSPASQGREWLVCCAPPGLPPLRRGRDLVARSRA